MQRLKLLVGALLLIFTFFILIAIHGFQPIPSSEIENLAIVQKQRQIDLDKQRQYRLLQVELKVAVAAYFKKAIAEGDIVGIGVSVVSGDSIILSEGFGKRNIDANEQVDGETVFRLGSLSKGFAGVLATELKDEGKLNWDDKVKDYLPEFELGDRNNTDNITLANILSHTSGAPYHSFTNLVEDGMPLAAITRHFKEVIPISKPGELYSYQNAMFALSGEIMKKATGEEINTLLDKRFFKPLGMYTANTDYETLQKFENVAIPHIKGRNMWKSTPLTNSFDNAVAAGGINASALDMAKWMRFLLGHNPEVMNKSALAEVFTPRVEIKAGYKYYFHWPGQIASYYGFGWRIQKYETDDTHEVKTIWHHGGSVNNFRNEIAVYPEADLGICVLMNSNSKLVKTVIPDLHHIVKGIYDKATNQQLPEKLAQTASLSFED